MRSTRFGYLLLGLLVLLAGRAAGQARARNPLVTGPRVAPGPPARPASDLPFDKGTTVAGPVPAGRGLQATYYNGSPRGPATYRRVEPEAQVTWWGISPAPGVAGRTFSVRWTGYLRAPETGLYVLHVKWDDATDIRFAQEKVTSEEDTEQLDVGQHYTAGNFYRLELTYKNTQGIPRAILCWSRPSELDNPSTWEQALKIHKDLSLTVISPQFLYPELPQPGPPAVVAARPVAQPAAGPLQPVALARPRPVLPRPGAPRPVAPPLLPDLATLRRGTAVVLPNLYFAQSTADLLPTSRPVLNSLAQKLRQQPALRLKIAGHTDNVGDARLNLRLSQQRASRVRRYLVQQGIDSLRLTTQGYGGAYPVADNRDPQQRPRNRRVEVVVQ